MQIENHKEEVPFSHYVQLFTQLQPEQTAAKWDGGKFYVNLLNREFAISHPTYAIEPLDGGEIPSLPVQTFLLRYLLEGKAADWAGTWKTFRQMPWGETYATPFAGRVLTRAAFTFGFRLDAFRSACEKLGGTAVNHGDAGYQFDLIGDYKMQILVWAGDEEFPPSTQILYSDNFAVGFTAEDRVVAGDILISLLKANM